MLQCYYKSIVLKVTYKLLCKFIFQVLLKQDNTTQLVQDDQVKGPLRVRMLYSLKSEVINYTVNSYSTLLNFTFVDILKMLYEC